MSSRKVKAFEFRLGKLGLFLFVFGISLFLLFAFIFGVIVGQNIETYPEKIARSIPGVTRQKITESHADVERVAKKKEGDFKLTFYDTLTRKREEPGKEKEKTPPVKGKYVVQVASFKDKKKADALHEKLLNMGYHPVVDVIELNSRGRWFRVRLKGFETGKDAKEVAKVLGKKVRWLKCLVIKGER